MFKFEFIYAIFLLFLILEQMTTIAQAEDSVKSALIVIDVQNCFIPGGSLAVPEGAAVIPVINSIRQENTFETVITTQDWHCPKHISFASQHQNRNVFETVELGYDEDGNLCSRDANLNSDYNGKVRDCLETEIAHNLNQTLWPDHCVMGTAGADLSSSMVTSRDDLIVKKGFNCEVDSYSAFFDNGGFSKTELNQKLKDRSIRRVFISGLALDFCVFYSAMDANHLGYDTYVIQDASRGITEDGVRQALEEMKEAGVKIIQSQDVSRINSTPLPMIACSNAFSAIKSLIISSILYLGLLI